MILECADLSALWPEKTKGDGKEFRLQLALPEKSLVENISPLRRSLMHLNTFWAKLLQPLGSELFPR